MAASTSSCASGIQVFSPLGDLLGEIDLPGAVNFCFGAGDALLITADDAISRERSVEPCFAHAE